MENAAPVGRQDVVRRGQRLEYFTVAWNGVEGLVSIMVGVIAGSVALNEGRKLTPSRFQQPAAADQKGAAEDMLETPESPSSPSGSLCRGRHSNSPFLTDNGLMSTEKPAPPVYQLKVTILDIAPPIWRRLQVPSTIKLCCLHSALQVTMGWTDSHLHQFEKDGKYWGVPERDEFGDLELMDEKLVPLEQLLKAADDSLEYVYDYGDDWRHEVTLEKIIPSDVPTKPVCLAGERRCPPEDVGGPHGYQDFLEAAVFDPKHEEFEHYRQWAGNPVYAEEFDLKAVNDTLSRLRWPVRHRR
jgi:hypothetical protein